MPSKKVWKSACESALWSNRINDRIECEYYRKQHSGGDVKIIKAGECNLVEFFKNWSPSDISDPGLIRLSDLVIKSMADQQMLMSLQVEICCTKRGGELPAALSRACTTNGSRSKCSMLGLKSISKGLFFVVLLSFRWERWRYTLLVFSSLWKICVYFCGVISEYIQHLIPQISRYFHRW